MNFLKSPVGGKARLLLAALFGISGMNVANSFVGRYFMPDPALRLEFGVIGQSATFFAALLGAFSLVIAILNGATWRDHGGEGSGYGDLDR